MTARRLRDKIILFRYIRRSGNNHKELSTFKNNPGDSLTKQHAKMYII